MGNGIVQYWERIVTLGVSRAPNEQLGRKIELTNLLSVLLGILGFPILIVFLLFGPYTTYIAATIVSIILCFSIPLLNSKGFYNSTRVLFSILTSLLSGVLPLIGKAYLFEPETVVSMYYVPRYFLLSALVIPLLLFDFSERYKLGLCIAINAFFLLGFDLIDNAFGAGFYQNGFQTDKYYGVNFYILINYLFLLSALVYLQRNNRHYESEIELLNRNLDSKVKEQTEALKEANDDLKAYNYTVSHELKTPLTAAQMVLNTLSDQFGKRVGEKGRQHFGAIEGCLNEMQQLIKNILVYSDVTGWQIKKAGIKMNALIQECIDEAKFAGGQVDITVTPVSDAYGAEAMIKVVMSNLISNAIKYSAHSKNPAIEIGGWTDGNEVVYYVKDNGIGFNSEQKEQLFNLFTRLHSKSVYEGSGVGLAIVKRIIIKHGGKIWAEGEPGKGATFYFSI